MKKIMVLVFTFLLAASIYAQSADVITDILDTKEVTFGQICYLTAVQLDYTDENSSYENAVIVMQNAGFHSWCIMQIYYLFFLPFFNI